MQHNKQNRAVYALAFGAHPDDVELSCGATLLKIINEGKSVAVCDLTRGEMGTLGTPESRKAEAEAAASIIGYTERITLDLGDGKLHYTDENLESIIAIIRHFRPTVVFANPHDERHPDHIKASRLVTDACYYAGLRQRLTTFHGRVQEPHRPHHLLYYIQFRHLEPHFVVDVSETFNTSRQAILAFATQFYREGVSNTPQTMINRPEFLTSLEARARYFGEQIGVLYGEGFRLSSMQGVAHFSSLFPEK